MERGARVYGVLQDTFFGGDGRSRLFVKYFICNLGNFGFPTACEIKKGDMAHKIMTYDGYDTKPPGANFEDINHQFVQFLVFLGKFHKKINLKKYGDDDDVKKIIDEVYAKWDELSDEVKSFFRAFVELEKNGAKVDQLAYKSAATDQNSKKSLSVSIMLKAFMKVIPLIVDTTVKFWISKTNSIDDITGDHVLQITYSKATQGKYDTIDAPKQDQFEGLMMGRLLRQRIFSSDKTAPLVSNAAEEDVFDFITGKIWKRGVDGILYMNAQDGTVVKAIDSDPNYIKMLELGTRCYSSSAFQDTAKCDKFLSDCLLNNDDEKGIKDCVTAMSDTGFYDNVKKEINSISPHVAKRILEKFGFKIIKGRSAFSNRELREVESVGSWLKRFKDGVGKSVAGDIEKNNNILTYFKHLVAFINSNPAILNEGYTGTNEVTTVASTQRAKIYGIKPWTGPKSNSLEMEIDRLGANLRGGYAAVVRNAHPLAMKGGNFVTPFDNQLMYGTVGRDFMLPQKGGKTDMIHKYLNVNSYDGGITLGSKTLLGIFQTLCNKLKYLGKEIREEDKNRIFSKIETMYKNEVQILKMLKYIEEYSNIIEDVGVKDSGAVSVDSLKELINSYTNMRQKQYKDECTMWEILNPFAKLMVGKSGDGSAATGNENLESLSDIKI